MEIEDEIEEARYSATLRIFSKTTEVEEITRLLKIEPDKFLIKGSRAVPNKLKSYVRPENMWLLHSDLDSTKSFEEHITRLVEFVESHADALKDLVKTCEINIFAVIFRSIIQAIFLCHPIY